MAQCDTCNEEISRSEGHLVSGPAAASIMREYYQKIGEGLGWDEGDVETALAMARRSGKNLVCDVCFARIQPWLEAQKREEEGRRKVEREAQEQRKLEEQRQARRKSRCCEICGTKLGFWAFVIYDGKCKQHRAFR